MRLAVFTNESRAIETEDDRQRLNGDVVNDAVVRALEERRIDRDHGTDSTCCQSSRERDRVRFGNADIKKASRISLCEQVGARATRHRRGDRDDLVVLRPELDESLAKDPLIGRRRRRMTKLARRRVVVRRKRMPFLEALTGRKALSLLRAYVHEPGTAQVAHRGEGLDHRVDVVAVDGTEIPKAELLEEHTRRQQCLETLFPAPHPRAESDRREQTTRAAVGEIANRRPHPVVQRVPLHRRQVFGDRADVRRD